MSTKERNVSVQRLKRMIIVSVVSIVLLPTILCFVLFAKVRNMQRDIDDLEEARLAQEVEFSLMMDWSGNQGEDYVVLREEVENVIAEQPADSEGFSKDQEEQVIYPEEQLASGTRKVYLTFDDGPSSETDEILDILKEYGVKATFFTVAKEDEQYTRLYQRIVEEGHSLGMHSYTHKYREIYASVEAFSNDITQIQNFLYDRTGERVTLYRFPGGSSNTVSRVPINQLISHLNQEGITYFDWNISSGDATGGYMSKEAIVENCMRNIQQYDTCVILMHDAADKKTTVQALPIIIERIMALDHTVLLPITEGSDLVQHRTAASVMK